MIPSGTAQYRHVNPDQGLSEVAALGQRDSIGGDVDQRTGQLWFAENARDWMAIIILSDKLNHLTRYGAMAVEGSPGAGRAKAEQAGCTGCHAADGVAAESGLASDRNVPNLAAEPDLHIRFQLVFLRKGARENEVMTTMTGPLSDFSNDDIRNLDAFYASLAVLETPQKPDPAPDDTRVGERVAQAIHCQLSWRPLRGRRQHGSRRRPARGPVQSVA